MKKWKSYIAYAVAGCMMLGAMPMQAFAEESEPIAADAEELTTEAEKSDDAIPEIVEETTATEEEEPEVTTEEIYEKTEEVTEEFYEESEVTTEEAEEITVDDSGAKTTISDIPSGQCGENAFWSFEEENNTLRIQGEGAIEDYSEEERAPWYSLESNIYRVEIESGITRIGRYNFADMATFFSYITLPDTLTEIGFASFMGCASLQQIDIPDSVTLLEGHSFSDCTSLYSVTLPEGLDSISYGLFYGDTELTEIEIPSTVTVIGGESFRECTSLKSIQIPDGVIEIGEMAFCHTNLLNVTIPENTSYIGAGAFADCERMWEATIQSQKLVIEDYAFGYTINSYGNYIKKNHFTIRGYKGTPSETYAGDNGFTFAAIGEEENKTSGECGEYLYWSYEEDTKILRIRGRGQMWDYEQVREEISRTDATGAIYVTYEYHTTAPWNTLDIETIEMSGGSSIGEYAFTGKENLKQISIPSGVKDIGEGAFRGCSSLEAVTLPDEITEIKDYAFHDCKALSQINLKNVDVFGYSAFWGCKNLSEVEFSQNLKKLGGQSFAYTGLTQIYLPENMEYLGNTVFSGCSNLTEVHLPSDLTSIPSFFLSGAAMESIELPDSLYRIGTRAFMGCKNLKKIKLPDSVTAIKEQAFYYAPELEEVTLSKNLSSIGEEAFARCEKLTSMELPATVEEVGYRVFNFCDNFKEITVLNKEMSFVRTAIGYYDGNSQTKTEGFIIKGYTGSTAEAYAAEEGFEFQALDKAAIEGKCGDDITWKYSETTKTLTLTGTGAMYDYTDEEDDKSGRTLPPWSAYAGEIKTVTLSEGITTIGSAAFVKTESLTNVSLPTTLKTIGTWGFGSSGIQEITLPEGLEELGYQTFGWCKNLTSITFPASLTNLRYETFVKCTSLKKIIFKGEISYIRDSIFTDCTNVEEINLAEGTETLGEYAFYNMNVKKITVPKSVTSIEEKALGYRYDEDSEAIEKIAGFTIQGYSDTAAETYAQENGFEFYALDKAENIKKDIISLTAAVPTKTGMGLVWSTSKNADTYKVYRKTGSGKYSLIKTIKASASPNNACIDTTAKSGTGYTYKVVASYQGVESKTKEKTAYYLSEPSVTLKAGASGITVSWKKVTGASGYYIYRKVGSGSYTKVATAKSTATSYLDKKASPGKTNTYKVYAYKSSPKTNSSYTAKSLLYLRPTKLTLTRKNRNATTINLKWTKVTGAKGYYIYRKAKGGKYAKIATIKSASTLKYTDKKAKKGVSYTYYVVAYNGKTVAPYTAKTK